VRRWPSAGAGAWAGGKGGRGGCVTLTQVGAVQPVHQPVLRARLQARARATGRCSVAPVPPQVVHRFSEWRDLNRRLGAVLAASEHGGRAAAAPLPHFPARLPFGGASVVARRQCASPPLRCPGPRPSHTPRPAASPAVLNAPRPQGPPNQAAASSAAPRAKPSAQPGPASRSPPPPATSSRRPADQVAHWHALRRRRRPQSARAAARFPLPLAHALAVPRATERRAPARDRGGSDGDGGAPRALSPCSPTDADSRPRLPLRPSPVSRARAHARARPLTLARRRCATRPLA
jgi:hypothetical protein